MSVPITPGSGASSVAAEIISGLNYQTIKLAGGETGSTSMLSVTPDGALKVSVLGGMVSSVSGTVGASVIGVVPMVQSGTVISSISGAVQASVQGIVNIFAPFASMVSGVTSIVTSTSQTSVLATAPGGQRNYITNITITNGAAVGTFVDVMDGPSVIYSGYAAASGGGFSPSFPTPLRQNNATTSVDIKATTQASIKAAINGFTAQ